MTYELASMLTTQLFETLFASFNILFTEVLSLAIPAIGVLMLSALCGAWVASHRSSFTSPERSKPNNN